MKVVAVVSALLFVAGAQLSVQYSALTSNRQIRLVYATNGCTGWARAEMWTLSRWNAISDCWSSSGASDFTRTDTNAFCTQIGYTGMSASSISGTNYAYFTQLFSVAPNVTTGAPSGAGTSNRVYIRFSSCSSTSTSSRTYCSGCSSLSMTTDYQSACSSTAISRTYSTTSFLSNPGMSNGARKDTRDVYLNCAGGTGGGIVTAAATCVSNVATSALYSSAQNAPSSAPSCAPTSSPSSSLGSAVAAAAGAVVAIVIISICCCLLCTVLFYAMICGGGLLCGVAICSCLGMGGSSSQSTSTAVASTNTNQNTVNVVVQPQQGQYPQAGAPAGSMYGQPQQYGQPQPVQYGQQPQQYAPAQGAAPGYGQAAPGYAPQQQGYGQAAPGYAPQY